MTTRLLDFWIPVLIAAPVIIGGIFVVGYCLLPLAAVLAVCLLGWR